MDIHDPGMFHARKEENNGYAIVSRCTYATDNDGGIFFLPRRVVYQATIFRKTCTVYTTFRAVYSSEIHHIRDRDSDIFYYKPFYKRIIIIYVNRRFNLRLYPSCIELSFA